MCIFYLHSTFRADQNHRQWAMSNDIKDDNTNSKVKQSLFVANL